MTALIPAARSDLALEFANTRYWRGRPENTETLTTLDDLLKWSVETGGLDASAVETFRHAWADHPRKGADALEAALALREALYRIFRAIAEDAHPNAADIGRLNAALAAAPPRVNLRPRDGAYVWELSELKPNVASLLAPVIWAAGDLLIEPARVKVRRCANDECVWLFLDDSKSGTRRWCDMKACGNRAKAHRHYAKQKKAEKKK
jgi:predicted RNA-binding Zn ribbon-like protein